MICIVGTRGSGKTTRLLELSAQSGVPIAVKNVMHATWLRRYMSQCGIEAPDPIVVGRGIYRGGRFASIEVKRDSDGMVPVLIDDVRAFFWRYGHQGRSGNHRCRCRQLRVRNQGESDTG